MLHPRWIKGNKTMSASCCGPKNINVKEVSKSFKTVLWVALILNFAMFLLENFQGLLSHSLSLRADAIDFLGDSANYFMTLFVLSAAVRTRAKVSLAKAAHVWFWRVGFD